MATRNPSAAGRSTTRAKAPTPTPLPRELIAQRAYEKWCQRGCPHGTDQIDWLEAELELQQELTSAKPRRKAKA